MLPPHAFEGHLAGAVFRGGRFRWEPGFYVTDVEGLLGGAEVTGSSIPKGSSPGVYAIPNRRDDPRAITLTAFAYARSGWELRRMLDRVTGLLGEDDDFGVLSWTELDNDRRHLTVQRFRSTEPKRRKHRGFADFSLMLSAPDPRIYGATSGWSAWGATWSDVHRGTYPASPLIQVRSATAYTIAGPRGRLVTVSAAAGLHEYDTDTGIFRINGVAQTVGVQRSDRLILPQGENAISVSAGELRVRFADTYLP